MCSARFYFYSLGARTWRKWNRAREWCGGGGKDWHKDKSANTALFFSRSRNVCKELLTPSHPRFESANSCICFPSAEWGSKQPRVRSHGQLFSRWAWMSQIASRASKSVLRNCLHKVFTPKNKFSSTPMTMSASGCLERLIDVRILICCPRRAPSNR